MNILLLLVKDESIKDKIIALDLLDIYHYQKCQISNNFIQILPAVESGIQRM